MSSKDWFGFSKAMLVAAVSLSLISCVGWLQLPGEGPEVAMWPIPTHEAPEVVDDLELESLKMAVTRSLIFLERLEGDRPLQYGPIRIRAAEARETLFHLLGLLGEISDKRTLASALKRDFLWLQAAGREGSGRILLTGYYVPRLEGRKTPQDGYVHPVYFRPEDLVEVDLGLFANDLKGRKVAGRVQKGRLIPYYTREEIDGGRALEGRGLEICWLKDPVEVFFLHIQGSGEVMLEDGTVFSLTYSASNGHSYKSIGKVLMDLGAIEPEEMSMEAIRDYLRTHNQEANRLMYMNPSYVFFRVSEAGPMGCLDVPLTPGRSIATDKDLFPPGALAVLCSTLPEKGAKGKKGPRRPFCRLVLNQDTGGAIKGPGRVDLYCGSGAEAELLAGNLQDQGTLFFLLKKGARSPWDFGQLKHGLNRPDVSNHP